MTKNNRINVLYNYCDTNKYLTSFIEGTTKNTLFSSNDDRRKVIYKYNHIPTKQ